MSLLAAVALATPIFGFALTPPSPPVASPGPNTLFRTPIFAQMDGDESDDEEETSSDEASSGRDSEAEPGADADDGSEGQEDSADSDSEPSDMSDFAARLRERQEIAAVHRAFGIATWGAMLVTVALGFIQYYNLYGFFSGREDTPCVQGNAVFGQDQCWGTPWPHRIAAFTTAALYTTTFVLSFVLPDTGLEHTGDLELHETLRWVHLAGMLVQMGLGLAVANNWFGIDRANDYDAQLALASVHQLVGWTTFGVLTAAGAIMVF